MCVRIFEDLRGLKKEENKAYKSVLPALTNLHCQSLCRKIVPNVEYFLLAHRKAIKDSH